MSRPLPIVILAAILVGGLLWFTLSGGPAVDISPLVIYSGRGEALVGPLLARFESDTGIALDIRYNDTSTLATQLLAEGDESPAQVFWAQDSGHLGALAGQDRLAAIPEDILGQVASRWNSPDGEWLATSGRLRVLVHNPSLLGAEQMPRALEDLAAERYASRMGWAPGNGSFQAHLSALLHEWGEERTRAWLTAIRDGGARSYPKNSPQVRAAATGEIALGWVNHYYLHKLGLEGEGAANWSFPAEGDPGNLLMVSGVGVLPPHAGDERVRMLLEYLVSEAAQSYFAQETFEYPVRPGVATHPEVQPLDGLDLPDLPQEWLVDVAPARALLEELGLL